MSIHLKCFQRANNVFEAIISVVYSPLSPMLMIANFMFFFFHRTIDEFYLLVVALKTVSLADGSKKKHLTIYSNKVNQPTVLCQNKNRYHLAAAQILYNHIFDADQKKAYSFYHNFFIKIIVNRSGNR